MHSNVKSSLYELKVKWKFLRCTLSTVTEVEQLRDNLHNLYAWAQAGLVNAI